jgi:hypothetical protein
MNPSAPLALGIVSDEIVNDFGEALRHGLSWGIRRYEIRCLATGRIPRVDAQELRTVAGLVRGHGVQVTALSPGMFKAHLSRTAEIEEELRSVLPFPGPCRDALLSADYRLWFSAEDGEPADRYHRAVSSCGVRELPPGRCADRH